jgi:glucose/arabinose dehydrogenase
MSARFTSGSSKTDVPLRDRHNPVMVDKFAAGWLQGNRAVGRPVDVLVMPDGALLVSDDHGRPE